VPLHVGRSGEAAAHPPHAECPLTPSKSAFELESTEFGVSPTSPRVRRYRCPVGARSASVESLANCLDSCFRRNDLCCGDRSRWTHRSPPPPHAKRVAQAARLSRYDLNSPRLGVRRGRSPLAGAELRGNSNGVPPAQRAGRNSACLGAPTGPLRKRRACEAHRESSRRAPAVLG
jgi:hypothetical protein